MLQAILVLLAGGFAAIVGASSSSSDDGSDGSGAPGATPSPTPTSPDTTSPDTGLSTPPDPTPVAAGTPSVAVSAPDQGEYALSWGGLSEEEQLVVELVNRARMDPAAEVARLSEPLAPGIPSYAVEPLAVTPELSRAAREHSQDLDDRNFFDHTNPDGQSPADRAVEAGHGSRYVGENIGWIASGQRPTGQAAQARVEAHHKNLWDSDGHQRGLMNENFAEIGVGYDYGEQRGYAGSTHVTEMFGNRGINYLTGVVIRDGDGDDFYDMGEGVGGVRITADNGTDVFGTSTWAAGGYTLALPPGSYRVTFEGGGLRNAYESRVTIGEDNVKLDLIEDAQGAVAQTSAATPPPEASDTLAALALPEVPFPPVPEEDPEEGAEPAELLV